MWTTILTTVIISVATAVLGIVGKVVTDWSARQKEQNERGKEWQARQDAISAIEVGVARAQQLIVDEAKEMLADKIISEGELKERLKNAEQIAKTTALEIATGPAAEYLGKLTFDAIGGLIDLVLGRNKQKK